MSPELLHRSAPILLSLVTGLLLVILCRAAGAQLPTPQSPAWFPPPDPPLGMHLPPTTRGKGSGGLAESAPPLRRHHRRDRYDDGWYRDPYGRRGMEPYYPDDRDYQDYDPNDPRRLFRYDNPDPYYDDSDRGWKRRRWEKPSWDKPSW